MTTLEMVLMSIVAGQNIGLLIGYYANKRDRQRGTETSTTAT